MAKRTKPDEQEAQPPEPTKRDQLLKAGEGFPVDARGLDSPVNFGWMRSPDYRGPTIVTSLPMGTLEDRNVLLEIFSQPSESLSHHAGENILVEHFIVERGTFEFEDGYGPELGCRIWLIAPDGLQFYSGSRSVAQCLERILTLFGLGPFKPPMDLKFTKGVLENGREWWNVERVI